MSTDISNVRKWAILVRDNTPEKVLNQIIARARNEYDFDFIDDVILFFKVILWIIALGILIPTALWTARKIYNSIKRTKETVSKK